MSLEKATFGAGCFWGVEAAFAAIPGVKSTAVGYEGGALERPSYKDVCTDKTGHAEVVEIEFDPAETSYEKLLDAFFSLHDPTTLNRQGPDWGTQYRSAIFTQNEAQAQAAEASRAAYQKALSAAGMGTITTEIRPAGAFYFAEDYHQQYLAKNPGGYCGIGGTGVSCPIGLGVTADGAA